MKNKPTIYEGTLEILGRRSYPIQAFNSKKPTPSTQIKVGDYATEIFRNIPQVYNGRRVILKECQRDNKNGGIIKDVLFIEGNILPLSSKRKYRDNKAIV
ncbi:hypothetical protein A3K82_02510 [Candidatus Pacearchaeota archaeon RBG_19FT_COMBO_34_9]|nr:MAG: hypothetical protein A3K82_02510 [Candidatus Pacearchaeota archaeon RBG_19FT_COMBO_34_9]OGJ16685.1 MAG: hypothetical protein A3K74_00520 [Candidatus Pacearchaeota archaeon RBG_13_33_26]